MRHFKIRAGHQTELSRAERAGRNGDSPEPKAAQANTTENQRGLGRTVRVDRFTFSESMEMPWQESRGGVNVSIK
jgi:hypothetical protein